MPSYLSQEPAYGYTSFDNRRFRSPEIDRSLGPIDDLRIFSAPCEASLYAIQKNVQKTDELFIKEEAYSLVHLLANDRPFYRWLHWRHFQTFLHTTGYHRWHAPVNGTIKKLVDIPGTYFAQSPALISEEIQSEDSKALPSYLKSLQFFTNTAARRLIFIGADNNSIGLMCFIAIGMMEISTCEVTAYEGQHVNRGDELGMFHVGGSSSAVLFNSGAAIEVDSEYTKESVAVPISAPIAVAAARPAP